MGDVRYTNKELARDYFLVAAQNVDDAGWENCNNQQKRIVECYTDIPSFYHEHGSLAQLNIKGIDIATEDIIRLILETGVEGAKRVVEKMRIRRIRRVVRAEGIRKGHDRCDRDPEYKHSRKGKDRDTLPSWDDVVREYEK